MKKIKVAIILISIVLIGFGGYIYKLQQLVNEGSYLADEHCIKVNPLIIDRKNKYTEQFNLMMASASAETYLNALDRYFVSSQAYMDEEKKWLPKQKKFLDSRWFNLIIPSYTRKVLGYQYDMYEAEYYSSVYLTQQFKEEDETKKLELANKVLAEITKSKQAGDNYNEFWRKGNENFYLISRFIKVPPGKCPEKNYDIPEVPNPFLPSPPPRSPFS